MLKGNVIYNNKRYYILPGIRAYVCSLVSNGRGANRDIGFCITVHVLSRLPFVARCSKPFRIPRRAADPIQDGREAVWKRARARDISTKYSKWRSEEKPYIKRACVISSIILRLSWATIGSCCIRDCVTWRSTCYYLARVSVLRIPFFCSLFFFLFIP